MSDLPPNEPDLRRGSGKPLVAGAGLDSGPSRFESIPGAGLSAAGGLVTDRATAGGRGGSDLKAEIEAEIADHLASAAEADQRAGCDVETAVGRAMARFGSIRRTRWKCYWIQQGDEIMLRAGVVFLALCVVVLLAVVLAGGWRMQSTLDGLEAAVSTMNETQSALLEVQRQANQPPQIRGMCYIGDPKVPAAGVEVMIFKYDDLSKVGTATTNAEGEFASPSLANGQYFVVAPLVGPSKSGQKAVDRDDFRTEAERKERAQARRDGAYEPSPVFYIQSAPLNVYAGANAAEARLDVQMFDYGRVALRLEGSVKEKHEFEQFRNTEAVTLSLFLTYFPNDFPNIPLDPKVITPNVAWPKVGVLFPFARHFVTYPSEFTESGKARSDVVLPTILTAGRHTMATKLVAIMTSQKFADRPINDRDTPDFETRESHDPRSFLQFEVEANTTTVLTVAPPQSFETDLLAVMADQKQARHLPRQSDLMQSSCKVSIAGVTPMAPAK